MQLLRCDALCKRIAPLENESSCVTPTYISQLIRNAWAARQAAPGVRSMDLDALRLLVQGLAGRVIAVEGEVTNLRSQLAALIAEGRL